MMEREKWGNGVMPARTTFPSERIFIRAGSRAGSNGEMEKRRIGENEKMRKREGEKMSSER